ncbi:MAG: hypothetical protein J5764_03065, partial [Bacteroidales bacterium]|nr:hypothetical protein [Bacteroidales bacterium]
PEGVQTGDRVRVKLAGREYIAVVSRTGVTPDMDIARVRPIEGVEEGLEKVSPSEIAFWRFISDYYLCSIGEVYREAYPATRTQAEKRSPRRKAPSEAAELHKKPLNSAEKASVAEILDSFAGSNSPVLYCSGERRRICLELSRRALEEGRSVLLVCAGSAGEYAGEALIYDSSVSATARRDVAAAVRKGRVFVAGGRASVFLPWTDLGLVIVQDEESPLHSGGLGSLHFNARDAAVYLATLHGAKVLLSSAFPSLETLLNCSAGKYRRTDGAPLTFNAPEIIDTQAEKLKNGMAGSFSYILRSGMEKCFAAGGKVLLLLPWKDCRDLEIEARALFPKAGPRLKVLPLSSFTESEARKPYSLVALLVSDFLFRGGDFRTDEKALRTLVGLCCRVGELPLVLQCAAASHPVIQALSSPEAALNLSAGFLSERSSFGLPPFKRLVEIVFSDNNEARLSLLSKELFRELSAKFPVSGGVQLMLGEGRIRILLPRDSALKSNKIIIRDTTDSFCASRKWLGHLTVVVDP